VTYQRIERCEDLPPAGPLNARSRERDDLDFKTFVDKRTMYEHAKDVAAFANFLGGVLLIGADNKTNPTVLAYPGVVGQTVADVATIYEKAGAMCSPPQNVNAVPMKDPSGTDIVAVNVDPSVHQLVASPGGQKEGHLWRFPIRRGSQTTDIVPEDLPMYMNQPVRRAYLMLASIPVRQREQVKVYCPDDHEVLGGRLTRTRVLDLRLAEVPPGHNFLVVGRSPSSTCRIPLGDVVDVWEEAEGQWAIKVSGRLTTRDTPFSVTYQPRF
jgi:hypothetical protein